MLQGAERRAFTAQSDQRVKILSALAAAGFLVLSLRLFQLQVIRGGELFRLAELNRTQIIPLSAPRGYVRDRHGEVLLDNAPRFSLFYSNLAVPAAESRRTESELLRRFPPSESLLRRKMAEARVTGKMTRLLFNLDRAQALAMIEKRFTLAGLNVVVEPQRRARFGSLACHVLGYVDEVSPEELERLKDRGYFQGQRIGKTGVEKFYDDVLRGQDGGLQFEMDASGRHVQVIRRIPSQSGWDLQLTIDRHLQEIVEAGLAKSPTGQGAVVVLDPRSGAVLALASSPGFDPTGDRLGVINDPALPLFNRALQGTYAPGSVFKIATAVAALIKNWDVGRVFYCPGFFRLGSKEFACWDRHNRKDFFGAVAWSCNNYFYNMGLQVGPDLIERTAFELGLGRKTGVDLPSESSGLIPGRRWKKEIQRDGWYDGDTVNFSIGQGPVVVTPLQAAVMVGAVANGGTVWQPHVVDKITEENGKESRFRAPSAGRRADAPSSVLETVRQAMQGTVLIGTARAIYRPDLVLGGKTGTAQNPQGKDHAWFACFAGWPGKAPSLAAVIFVEHGGRGSVAAGPIARELINAAFPKAAPAGK